jgi:hypothetical protein
MPSRGLVGSISIEPEDSILELTAFSHSQGQELSLGPRLVEVRFTLSEKRAVRRRPLLREERREFRERLAGLLFPQRVKALGDLAEFG